MIAFLYDDGLVLLGPSHQMIAVALGKSLDKYRELLALILLVLPSADVGLQADELVESVYLHLLGQDRKSTRLNSSHANISYAVFCLKQNHLLLPLASFSFHYIALFH